MEPSTLGWLTPVVVTLSAVAIPLVAERMEQCQLVRHRAERAEARRKHVRRVFPPLLEAPLPPFKGAPAVDKQLSLDTVLFSDQTALMTCEVVLDGDCVQGVFTMELADERGLVPRTLAQLETVARQYPHQEWLLQFTAPLQSLVYQRHAEGQWNLVRTGPGVF